MARENTAGLGVNTRYGPISLPDGARGTYHSQGALTEISVDWSANLINSDSIGPVLIVKNMLPLRAWLEVEEALSLSGTSAGIAVGFAGGLATDCAEVTGTSVGVGFATATLLGKFITGITATQTLVVGVTSGSINAGAGRFVIECLKI
jgi:hypothetical protein